MQAWIFLLIGIHETYYYTFYLLTILVVSCNSQDEKPISYFGGEIINPNSPYVFLYKNDVLLDSAALDENNRFLMPLNDIEEGLYHFEHDPEYQYIFIEKGDSILIRLNTYDFDESLVFTGKGAAKNNFLIEMFLVGEDEERLVYNYYKSGVEDFKRRMDSLLAMKVEQYENLITDYDLSENAKNITKASIDYAHYTSMEIYPYMHKKHNNLDDTPELTGDFYGYRKLLDDSDERLSYFRPYFKYMVAKTNNLSYVYCTTNRGDDSVAIEKTLQHHVHKLHIADSLVDDAVLRGNLHRNTAYSYLLEDHHPQNNKTFVKRFNMFSENDEHTEEINQLYRSKQELKPGKRLPNLYLVDANGTRIEIKNIYDTRNKVYYFWSTSQKNHIKIINKKVKALQDKYPSYQFVGININNSQEMWLKHVKAYRLCTDNQFRTEDFTELSEKLILNDLNKVIITLKDGTIIDAFANIYRKNFEIALQNASYQDLAKNEIP